MSSTTRTDLRDGADLGLQDHPQMHGARWERTTNSALAGFGVTAGALTVIGVALPWVSTFAGLVSMSGMGSPNGRVLIGLGVLTIVASVVLALRRDVRARWAIGILGFLTAVLAGYLLVNLYAALRSADSMALPSVGPGLAVSLAGGALGLATLLLPWGVGTVAETERARPRPGRTVLRCATALFATIAAVAHIPVTPEHLREATYIGVGFMLLTAALLILSAGLLTTDSRIVWLLTLGVSAAAVVAYVVSRSIGLPLIGDDVGNWLEPLGVVSVLTETAAAGLSARALMTMRSARADR